MNERSINLVSNLCAAPFPGASMPDAISAFKAHCPVIIAELRKADNDRLTANRERDEARAQLSMAHQEVQRLRTAMRKIRSTVSQTIGKAVSGRDRDEE